MNIFQRSGWTRAGALTLLGTLTTACQTVDVAGETGTRALHEWFVVLDTHLDTPVLLEQPGWNIMARHTVRDDYSQVDLPRMVDGGLDGGFWVIYTPQGPVTETAYPGARDAALMRGLAIHKMVAEHGETFELALNADDAERIAGEGKRVVYISMENAYPLGDDISLLESFYKMGLRMVGPVHFKHNQFASSGTDLAPYEHGGLSPLGEELVREANRLGLIIDASHASDTAFDDMLELSATPIILSHTGIDTIYSHGRNLDDERLLALAEKGGVIHINAYSGYMIDTPPNPERSELLGAARQEFMAIKNPTEQDYLDFLAKRREIDDAHPVERADIEDFYEHLLHALELIGPDHVGVGADWDGGGGLVGMEDISSLPLITARLLEEGYTREDLAKIWGGNAIRLLRAAEDYAAELAAESDD